MPPIHKRLKLSISDLFTRAVVQQLNQPYVHKITTYIFRSIKHTRDVWGRLGAREICFSAFIGLTLGGFITQNVSTSILTTLLILISTAVTIGIRSSKICYPVKTFYLDFPVHGVTPVSDNQFVVTGGGGGMTYGVADEAIVFACVNSKREEMSGTPLNLFVQYNDDFHPSLAASLHKTELQTGELLPGMALWGLSSCISKRLVAGGYGGSLKLFKRRNQSPSAPIDSIAEHVIVKQSVTTKKKILLIKTLFSESGDLLLAITENNRVCLYSVPIMENRGPNISRSAVVCHWLRQETNSEGKLILLAEMNIDMTAYGIILDARFTVAEDMIILLTLKGMLIWISIPSSLAFLKAAMNMLTSSSQVDLGADFNTVAVLVPKLQKYLTIVRRELIPFSDIFVAKQILYRAIEAGSTVSEHELILPGVLKANKWSDRATAAIVTGTWIADKSIKEDQIHLVDNSVVLRKLNRLNCITSACFSKDKSEFALISNTHFLTLDSQSMKVTRHISRFELGTSMMTLPTTCVTYLQNDRYLIVGAADYSITVCALSMDPEVEKTFNWRTKLRHALRTRLAPLIYYFRYKLLDLLFVAATFWILPNLLCGLPSCFSSTD